jgi:hypothetical protein
MADDKKQTKWVKSGLKDNRVALWERHNAHPGGEVFVAGKDAQPVEVALTAQVERLLGIRHLVEVSAPSKSERAAAPQSDAGPNNDELPPANPEPQKKGK